MTVFSLAQYLDSNPGVAGDGHSALWRVGDHHNVPGFWVAMAALARHNKVSYADIHLVNEGKHRGYCEAIALPVALGAADPYPHQRKNEGRTYSPLVLLDDALTTDRATSDVNGCIRNLCSGLNLDKFSTDLCEVVGDLHDNVWSHGKSTGFSMAQRWSDVRHEGEAFLEFALADCGIGFRREMKRVGLHPKDDQEAICWCIERGNSSKLYASQKKDDGWDQWLPPDMSGNPMPSVGRIKESDNHHQGLGLAKLVSLVERYKGELCLTTGNAILRIDSSGRRTFGVPKFEWPGVALSCRFSSEQIKRISREDVEATDGITKDLFILLGGEHEH